MFIYNLLEFTFRESDAVPSDQRLVLQILCSLKNRHLEKTPHVHMIKFHFFRFFFNCIKFLYYL